MVYHDGSWYDLCPTSCLERKLLQSSFNAVGGAERTSDLSTVASAPEYCSSSIEGQKSAVTAQMLPTKTHACDYWHKGCHWMRRIHAVDPPPHLMLDVVFCRCTRSLDVGWCLLVGEDGCLLTPLCSLYLDILLRCSLHLDFLLRSV